MCALLYPPSLDCWHLVTTFVNFLIEIGKSTELFGFVLHSFVQMTSKRESPTLSNSPDEEMQVEHNSHTPSEEEVEEVTEPCSYLPRRIDESRRAPNPFPERGAADVLATLHRIPDTESNIITNPLDEEQERAILV